MLPTIKYLTSAELSGKTVWLRVDFNVPIKDGVIAESYRIDRSLPTIQYLQNSGAKIILATHLSDKTATLEPIINYLQSKINLDNITILPNLRTWPGEEENSEVLAKEWASSADLYVNEAFAASHRAHASIVSLPKLLPSYVGLNFNQEIENLSRCFDPVSPSLLIVGGGKIESKQPVIAKFLPLVDKVLIGGALVKVFLDSQETNSKIMLPPETIKKDDLIVDVVVSEEWQELIKKSRRLIWAGPMGIYDQGYSEGTISLAKAIAESAAESIVGGGDTIAATPAEFLNKFTFVSTGGGAMLQFLATGTLPGIEALKDNL